LLQFVPQLI